MSSSLQPAEARALEALRAQARRSASHQLKRRARDFAKNPMMLDVLWPGLAAAEPQTMIAIAEHLLERERKAPPRWFGFGGEVSALNAKATLLYGRALRRAQQRRSENAAS